MDPVESAALEILLGSVPESHHAAVGKVAAYWSVLEKLAERAIWRFAKVDDGPGACITSQIYSLEVRLKALIAILKLRDLSGALVGKLNKFAGDMSGLGEQRNRVVHDPWTLDLTSGVPQRLQITAKRTLVMGYQPVPTEEVTMVVGRIYEAIWRFYELMGAAIGELEAPTSGNN